MTTPDPSVARANRIMSTRRWPTSPAASPEQVRDVDVALNRGIEVPDLVREIPADGHDFCKAMPDASYGPRGDPGHGTFAPGVVAKIAAGTTAIVNGERLTGVDEAEFNDALAQRKHLMTKHVQQILDAGSYAG